VTATRNSQFLRTISLLVTICLFSFPAQAQYSGGTGEPNDPYQIATTGDLMLLGESPNDYDKHFVLIADIDLDPNLPGRKVFNKAVIASDTDPSDQYYAFRGTSFTGTFVGNGFIVRNLTIRGEAYLGLFGHVSPKAEVRDLGVVDGHVVGIRKRIGILVGENRGTLINCYSSGFVSSEDFGAGGLVGYNGGNVTHCYSTAEVQSNHYAGGLMGAHFASHLTDCYSTGTVSGNAQVGGLLGYNYSRVSQCYSSSSVTGHNQVGGLVGWNGSDGSISKGLIENSYSSGPVTGHNQVGGLVGSNSGNIINSFWDIETSGHTTSAGGAGKTIAEMQTAATFMEAGWGCNQVWTIDEGKDYPRLLWENKPGETISKRLSDFVKGSGEPNDPYLIYTAEQFNMIGLIWCDWDKHFKLMADINLNAFTGTDFNIIGISYNNAFTGVFDGNGKKISNFNCTSTDKHCVGLFAYVSGGAEIKDLGLIDPNIDGGTGDYVGSLVGWLRDGTITGCYVEGGIVSGNRKVGGLVGENYHGTITNCYSAGRVVGERNVGGLAGCNWGDMIHCYSTGAVSGNDHVGGLVGSNYNGTITGCFWDIQTSGKATSAGGIGKKTAEMQMSITFYGWGGWDNEGNGLWTINEGNDYPRLWWENAPGDVIEPTQLPTHATSPSPPDGAIHEDTWIRLSWLPGGYAVSHRVYFGDNFDDVNDGTGGTFRDNRTSTSYVVGLPGFAYPYGLVPGTTYYWRIDEVNNIHPESPCKGDVWYFTVPHRIAFNPSPPDGAIYEDTWVSLGWSPGDYAVSHDVYFSENFDDVNDGVESTFQGNQIDTSFVVGFTGFAYPEGLVPGTTYYWRVDEVNDTEPNSPWKGDVWSFWSPPKTAYAPEPADGAEQINPSAKLSWTAGLGAKLHAVYFGDDFDTVNNAAGNLPQETTTYDPGPLRLVKTYYWRVDELDGVFTHKGDVWSFITQGAAGSPEPDNGAEDITQSPVLTWVHGIFADTHQVYFGTDAEAVKNADAGSPEYKGTGNLGSESYDAGQLEWNTTYYWRIDEVNNANADSPWIGPVWSFTTANFIIVDGFEFYNDLDPDDPESNRIFETWIDGWGDPTNGSLVDTIQGHAPWGHIVAHGGVQSMWYYYDNSVGKSEATITLIYPRDWTEEGVGVLSLWFYGDAQNATEPMYVALANANGLTTEVYHDNPDAIQMNKWTEWRIDLQAFADQGVNLANVNTITLGFGNRTNPIAGGSGEVWFDDIRLYRSIPEL